MKNSVHDNGGFIGRVADYASEDYYTVLQQGSAYEVANATYTNVSIATGSTGNLGVVFSADGTKVYFQSANNNTTKFATLSTPSDLSTASSLTSVSSGNGSQSITFNPTGTKVYHTAYSGGIYFASLSTAWDLTTRGSETAISSGISQPRDLQFNNDGTKLYVIRSGSIYSFPLASAYTITSTDVASSNRTTQSLTGGDQQGFRFNSDGTKLFAIHGNGYSSNLLEYSLSTAYDITTIGSPTTYTTTASQVSDAHDFTFSHDGTNFYVVGVNSSNVYEYSTTTAVNGNKKNTGVWSMDADYLNAELTPVFASGLIMHLDAKQGYSGSGTTWSDISGNNYDASLIGAINYTSGSQAKFTWAGGQTGSRLHLSTSALSNLTDGYEWTIEFVISINSTSGTTYLNSMATSYNNNYYIAQKAGGALRPYSESRLSGSDISLTASETFVFTIVHSGSSQKYYKNGYLSGTWNGANDISQTQGWILNQEQDSVLGGLQSGQATAMSASAILLFDKPLTDVEVLSNYNAHKAEYGLP